LPPRNKRQTVHHHLRLSRRSAPVLTPVLPARSTSPSHPTLIRRSLPPVQSSSRPLRSPQPRRSFASAPSTRASTSAPNCSTLTSRLQKYERVEMNHRNGERYRPARWIRTRL